MFKRNLQLFVIILLVLSMVACRHGVIREVNNAPVVTKSNDYSLSDIDNAIARAGSSLGWEMRTIDQGKIEGTLHLRAHTAIIDIFYDRSNYSINYKDSDNLNYRSGRIHSNYNGWIQNLERAINNELVRL